MDGMMKKLITTISGVGKLPKMIIMHGIQISSGLLAIALVLYHVAISRVSLDANSTFIAFTTAKTGITLFAESIICGLLIDYLSKKI